MTTKQTEALKLALEALEQYEKAGLSTLKTIDAIVSLREALAERCVCGEPDTPGTHRTDGPCLAEQPAQQEPVAWITQNGKGWLRWHKPEDNNTDSVPLYTSPPYEATPLASQRSVKPWVRLSTDEIYDMYNEPRSDAEMVEFARAIEAKLKGKNA